MELLYPWFGDIYKLGIPAELACLTVIVSSVLCGALVGFERERRDKPAGMRTVILICVGSTIFTMTSILLGESKPMADPARIASQIVPGVGFLGAGAIIRLRGSIQGLTTGATIWAVAAVGVVVGIGYVLAGVLFTLVIFATLSLFRRLEDYVVGLCRHAKITLHYRADNGKTRPRIQAILDIHQVPDERVRDGDGEKDGEARLTVEYCTIHRNHRVILKEFADLEGMARLES
ncbi:MAG: MgtC/SapB family protein [Planctomycetota bacterium]|nr:MgtC/SapB family protein [Planctomycetota bacterium]